jgi:hypothetical protein
MNTQAIERIKGYCCEVDKHQWNALLIAAKDVGAKVFNPNWSTSNGKMVVSVHKDRDIVKDPVNLQGYPVIPFPDFLAKLKGEEWQPKAGEMVEVSMNGKSWAEVPEEYIVFYCGKHVVKHMTVRGEWIACVWNYVRPLRPTITRTEAEQLLNKRIID